MSRRLNHLLPLALTGVVCFTATGSLLAQQSLTSQRTGGGSGSYGSGSSMSGGSSSSAFGLSSNLGLTSSGTSGSSSPFGNSAGAGSSSSSGVGATSLFGSYYATPEAAGVPGAISSNGTTRTTAFGQQLFNISTSSIYNTSGTGTTGGGRGGRGGAAGGGYGANTGVGGANINRTTSTTAFTPSTAYRSSPSFATRIAFAVPAPAPRATVQANLQQMIGSAEQLPSRTGIKVQWDGDTIVLRGQVSNNEERRVAESLILLEPGVRTVRNELVPRVTTED
jgi:hypothetical protein